MTAPETTPTANPPNATAEAMPLTGPGKHDRAALRRLAERPDEIA
ncbi:hypothetical protein [Kytococcus sedentarius]